MKYKLVYLPAAEKDITAITLYISEHLCAPQAALDLLGSLDKAISGLAQFPYAYRVYQSVQTLENEYRLLPVGNYGIFYVVDEESHTVEIQRIIYARVNIEKLIK